MPTPPVVARYDAFDLPDWLGTDPVCWSVTSRLHETHLVAGELTAGQERLGCDLLGCDSAYPAPVLSETWRREAHLAWYLGQVLLLTFDGRITLAVPGSGFTAELAMESIARLAKAVGAPRDHFRLSLRL